MTEYEIADLALSNAEAIRSQAALVQDQASLIGDRVNVYYTVLFSYLTVAYFVGASFSKVQVGVLNLLYLSVIFINRGTMFRDIQVQREFRNGLRQLHDAAPLPEMVGLSGSNVVIAITVIMVLASLFFMWSVRNPKTE